MTFAKRCACGASYDTSAWERLEYVGEMHDDIVVLELRNCPCGSTLAIVVENDDERSVA